MIRGFKDETAKAVFDGENPKGFPSDILSRSLVESFAISTLRRNWRIFEPRPATALRH